MLKKIAVSILIVIGGLVLLIFVLISPIAKYVIEKNSKEWIGRKVTIESLWVNLFTGGITLKGLNMFEANDKDIFFSFKEFYGNIELYRLFASKYEITEIKFQHPEVNIMQDGGKFNFDDIVKKFSDTTGAKEKSSSEETAFWIRNISIDDAVVNYSSTKPTANVSIVKLHADCPLVAYDDPIYSIKSGLDFKSGGKVNMKMDMNSKSMSYAANLDIDQLNLIFIYPYIRDFMKIKSLDGILSSNLQCKGSFDKPGDIVTSGAIDLNGFSIVDTTDDKLASIENVKIVIDSINTPKGIYNFSSIDINKPFVKFALYEDGYNFDRIMNAQDTDSIAADAPVEEYTNIFQMLANFFKDLTSQYVVNDYGAQKYSLTNGHIIYTDYTLEDKFLYDLDSLNITSSDLSSQNERIKIALDASLNKSGKMEGMLSVNPNGFKDMEIYYAVRDLQISDINPYSKFYVASKFVDGTVLFEDSTTIVNNFLKSKNKLQITKIDVTNKLNRPAIYNLPVKLAVIILRDAKGNIDLEIPVEGDLNDPKYKLWKAIWHVFSTLIVKAATAPYNLLASQFGGKEEDYKEIRFTYMQESLSEDQQKILANISNALLQKPQLKLELVQLNNLNDEIEQRALFESKTRFLGIPPSDSMSASDMEKINGVSNKDSLFNTWLNAQLNTTSSLNSVQDRCIKLIGKDKLTAEVTHNIEMRNKALTEFFLQKNINAARMKITTPTAANANEKQTEPRYAINFSVDDGAMAEAGK